MTKLTHILLVTAVHAMSCEAGEREEHFLNEKMLPAARAFIRHNQMPLDFELKTNRVTAYKVDFNQASSANTSRMLIDGRHQFSIFEYKTGAVVVVSYRDINQTKYLGWDPLKQNVPKLRAQLGDTNVLDIAKALALATNYFILNGHRPENFHPIEIQQEIWGAWNKDTDPEAYIELPYYVAEWVRIDIGNSDPKWENSTKPSVRITVSGITSNMVEYGEILLHLPISAKSREVELPAVRKSKLKTLEPKRR